MERRLRVLIIIAVILAAAYGVSLMMWSDAREPLVGLASKGTDVAIRAYTAAKPQEALACEEVVLQLELPAKGEPLKPGGSSGGAHNPRCPQKLVSKLLGVGIANPHGIRIGSVVSDGVADAAGVKVGDSIAKCGDIELSCPSDLAPHLGRKEEPRIVEITVRRPIEEKAEETSPEAVKDEVTEGAALEEDASFEGNLK